MKRPIANVLFVCTGNICRSPFAEGLFNKLAAEKQLAGIKGDSAGLLSLPGNEATYQAQRVAAEHGVDLTHHKAKSVSQKLVARSDLILVMEKSHEEALLEALPEASGKVLLLRHFARYGARRRGIADPYGLAHDAYRFCFLDIQDPVSSLIQYLSGPSMGFEPIQVNCYEGYKASESPRSFTWKDRTCTLVDIVDRWQEGSLDETSEALDYYKVLAEGGGTYIIRYNRLFDSWALMIPKRTDS